jgi:hypothetical protein
MPMIIACKLPHGLSITHNGQTININGTNVDGNPLNPAANGAIVDGPEMSGGFGLTTLNDEQAKAFEDWSNKALYKDGEKAKGFLEEPFLPLKNSSIISFKSEADARKETKTLATAVTSGFDGLDGDAEIKKAAASASPNLVNSGADKKD